MEMLVEHNISGIPVVEEDMSLVGIISEKDIIRFYADPENLINKPVSDFMTQPVIYFEENESILEVSQCLANNDFRRVPVTSSGKSVGVISRRDIIRKMLMAIHAHAKSIEI
jgi:CBS domain-containing protein